MYIYKAYVAYIYIYIYIYKAYITNITEKLM